MITIKINIGRSRIDLLVKPPRPKAEGLRRGAFKGFEGTSEGEGLSKGRRAFGGAFEGRGGGFRRRGGRRAFEGEGEGEGAFEGGGEEGGRKKRKKRIHMWYVMTLTLRPMSKKSSRGPVQLVDRKKSWPLQWQCDKSPPGSSGLKRDSRCSDLMGRKAQYAHLSAASGEILGICECRPALVALLSIPGTARSLALHRLH